MDQNQNQPIINPTIPQDEQIKATTSQDINNKCDSICREVGQLGGFAFSLCSPPPGSNNSCFPYGRLREGNGRILVFIDGWSIAIDVDNSNTPTAWQYDLILTVQHSFTYYWLSVNDRKGLTNLVRWLKGVSVNKEQTKRPIGIIDQAYKQMIEKLIKTGGAQYEN